MNTEESRERAQMHGEPHENNPALAELRQRLRDSQSRKGLELSVLAGLAGLSRTTVYNALKDGEATPSEHTVRKLARALSLDADAMVRLRGKTAASKTAVRAGTDSAGPGRPIRDWDPHDLEVHPAGIIDGGRIAGVGERRDLPGYVTRDHDQVLATAVENVAAGHSRMVVLVGSSSTGKTRACWEAVQPLSEMGWRLWHPFDPTRAQAALEELHRVQPRTVVWLNETQHYLGEPGAGEHVAAALHSLLTDRQRGPVLVLGTLWPEYASAYTARPPFDQPDHHSRVRELLAGRTHSVPDTFSARALEVAAKFAEDGDDLLADALTRAREHGRLAQDLAGAPELLASYHRGTPAARAILEAAMDARRLGVGLNLPQAFLTDAAIDYLTDADFDQLTQDWAEAAFAELARPVHGKQAPLRRTHRRPTHRPPGLTPASSGETFSGPAFRLSDYLEQQGRNTRHRCCPPGSFWNSAYTHLTRPDDLRSLGQAADDRHRLQWAQALFQRAAATGDANALRWLAELREETGDQAGAEVLFQQAADAGDGVALRRLAGRRNEAGDRAGAEALLRRAADAGEGFVLELVAQWRKEAGDQAGAESLLQQAADAGDSYALGLRALWRKETGDQAGAEVLFQQAAERAAAASDADALRWLGQWREEAGDQAGAEALFQQAADAGDDYTLRRLAVMRKEAGDLEGAEALVQRAANAGLTFAFRWLAAAREEAGDREGAEALFQQAADAGDYIALRRLAAAREEAGDREGAEALFQRAADAGYTFALCLLAQRREQAGDLAGAEAVLQRAADAGCTPLMTPLPGGISLKSLWPYGLNPDGTPTEPWQ
ncbi:helix-turn-helix domain-containing protein [Streptomyces sp. NPDC059718]